MDLKNRSFFVLLPLVASLAALLNVLLCILHCHFAALLFAPASHSTTHIREEIYICHTPGGESGGVPSSIDPGLLRALQEAGPPVASLLLMPLALAAGLWLHDTRRSPLLYLAPEPPPPRLLFA